MKKIILLILASLTFLAAQDVKIKSAGTDADDGVVFKNSNDSTLVDIDGTGVVNIKGIPAAGATLRLFEAFGNGTNYLQLNPGVSLGENATWSLSHAGGSGNMFLGYESGSAVLSSGAANIGLGYNAAKALTSGLRNVALGYKALTAGTSANYNIAIGYQAGDVLTTGQKNIIIGSDADPSAASGENQVVIGYEAVGTADNQVVLGNSSTTQWVPGTADATDLGSTAAEFNNLYLGDGAVVNLGVDQDVSLTHIADTGVRLNGASQLQFRNANLKVSSSAVGQLDLDANNELELVAPIVDIDASTEVNISDELKVGGKVTTGSDGSGVDVVFYSNTSGDDFIWDASEEKLIITGTNGQDAIHVVDGDVRVNDNAIVVGNITANAFIGDGSNLQNVPASELGTLPGASPIVLEGETADGFETTVSVTDPTADRIITLPDGTGTLSLTEATETLSNKTLIGPVVAGSENSSGSLHIYADDGDDDNDKWRLETANGGSMTIDSKQSGSWSTLLTLGNTGDATVAGDLTVTGNDITFGNGESISNGTDGTVAITATTTTTSGALTATGAITGGSLTDGTATISSGALSGATTVTASGLVSGGSLDIDDVVIDGTTIGHTDDTDLMTLTSGTLTVAGTVAATTLTGDGSGITGVSASAIKADDVSAGDAAVTISTTSGAVNITPASGSAIVLDGTINVDAGVITGATSITSAAFVASTSLDVTGATGIILQNDETITNSTDGTVLVTAPTTSLSGDLTVTGNDITFGNGESISNGTDGTVAITATTTTTSGALTAAGAITGGSLTDGTATISSGAVSGVTSLAVDNVKIDGTTIGHTDDTDLITLASGAVTVAGTATITGAATLSSTAAISGNTTVGGTLGVTGATTIGSDGSGVDVIMYSGTSGDNMTWDASEEQLVITGTDGQTALSVADGNLTVADAATVSGVLTANANLAVKNGATSAGGVSFYEDSDNGSNYMKLQAGAMSADVTLTLPTADGSNGQVIVTDGSGTLSWSSVAATSVSITDNESTDESNALVFTSGGDVDGGSMGLESDGTATYNPSTGVITATGFSGSGAGIFSSVTADTLNATDGIIYAGVVEATILSGELRGDGSGITGVSASSIKADDVSAGDAAVTIATSTGDITVDSPADVVLDADGADIILKDGGTQFGTFTNSSSDFVVTANVQDKDIIFKGNDGGSAITALTIDMSDAGAASFNGNLTVSGDVTITGDDLTMSTNTSGAALIGDGTNFNPVVISGDISIGATGTAAIGTGVIVDADVSSSAAIADSKLATISTANKVGLAALDIDGGTDIGAAIADADLFIIDDGAGGTNRKITAARLKTYAQTGVSSAADDITAGDAAVTLQTSSGNITIDATANDADIIFKGTDNNSDITMLTLDGSEAGNASFNGDLTVTGNDITFGNGESISNATDGDFLFQTATSTGALTLKNTNGTDGIASLELVSDNAGDVGDGYEVKSLNGTFTITSDHSTGGTYNDTYFTISGNSNPASSSTTIAGDLTVGSNQVGGDGTFNGGDLYIDGLESSSANLHLRADNSEENNDQWRVGVADGGVMTFDSKISSNYVSQLTLTPHATVASSTTTIAGGAVVAGTVASGAITSSGIIKTDDATEATSTTDGSLQTDGGLSVAKDAVIGDDLKLLSDAAVLGFGANSDVKITHDPDNGLYLKSTATADNNPFVLTLQTGETAIEGSDVLGAINFQAPDEANGTNAILVGASIEAVAEGTFDAQEIHTKLVFKTASDAAAAERLSISSGGWATFSSGATFGSSITSTSGTFSGDLTVNGNDINFDADASRITLPANGAADDLTIAVTGAQNSSLVLKSAGTGADAVQLTASAGGIDIYASGAAAGEDIDIVATGSSVNVTSTENAANAIYVRANGGTSETIKIHADQGTGASSIGLVSDAGGVTISAASSGQTNGSGGVVDFNGSEIENYKASIYTDANAHTLTANENGKVLIFTSGSSVALTVPAGLAVGFNCLIVQTGNGQVTLTASSTNIYNRSSHTRTAGQYAIMTLISYDTNKFISSGDGAAAS